VYPDSSWIASSANLARPVEGLSSVRRLLMHVCREGFVIRRPAASAYVWHKTADQIFDSLAA
jgi:hypothetical protein